jgi:hypothetical protein
MSVKRREDEGKECMHVSIKSILTLKKVTINAQTSKGSLPSTTESNRSDAQTSLCLAVGISFHT